MGIKVISSFYSHKKKGEYEDAYNYKASGGILRVAVADGATSACFPKILSNLGFSFLAIFKCSM